MRYLLSILILTVGLFIAWTTYQLRTDFQLFQDMKEDMAEINRIDYGLFNIQQWKSMAMDVFTGEIDKFEISSASFLEAEAELRKYLYGIYDKYISSGALFDEIIADAEKEGKVNKMMLKLFKENIKDQIGKLNIKEHIPGMAAQLAVELKKSEPRFRKIMQQELTKMVNFDEKYVVTDPRSAIYEKYGQNDLESCNIYLKKNISESKAIFDSKIGNIFYALCALILITFSLYKPLGGDLAISLVSFISLIFLLSGISFPMIEIDARLNSFVFNLFERDISFGEQNIFYQSKSILGVTRTLIEGKGLDLKIVGYMVLCFSIVFPAIKLILSGFILNSDSLRSNKWVRSIIFYLGKWSMADVFVVALFMAYIGFHGLFEAQLSAIEQNRGGFGVETVNYTHLGPGALYFTSYCILSIITGILISRRVQNTI